MLTAFPHVLQYTAPSGTTLPHFVQYIG